MPDTLTATIAGATSEIDATVWNGLVAATDPHANPFLDHAFFLALEGSGSATRRTGWTPRHVILRDQQRVVGLLPMYLENVRVGRARPGQQPKVVTDHGALVTLGFEDVEDAKERAFFYSVPTSFRLPDETVDKLIGLARRLLRESPDFAALLDGLR